MKVSELIEKAGFRAVTLPDAGREIKGAYAGDLLSWVMGRAKADDAWITIIILQKAYRYSVLRAGGLKRKKIIARN